MSASLAEAGIPRRRGRRPSAAPRLRDPRWLRRRYEAEGASLSDLASELGCNREAVRRALVSARIPLRPRSSPVLFPRLRDRTWLEHQLALGMTPVAIAAEVRSPVAAVHRALRRAGLRVGRRTPTAPARLRDAEWLQSAYVDCGVSQAQIAAELSCSVSAVGRALRRAGIGRPSPAQRRSRIPKLVDTGWLRQRYVDDAATMTQIAAELGCGRQAVSRSLERADIPRSRRPRTARLLDAAWLRRRYTDEHAGLAGIAAELGCSGETVRRALLRAGIPRRKPGTRAI